MNNRFIAGRVGRFATLTVIWSAARGSHPDLLLCRQVPALAGSRQELARAAGIAPTLPVLETGVLALDDTPIVAGSPGIEPGSFPLNRRAQSP